MDTSSWEVPPLYKLIQKRLDVPKEEMYRVFNMGVAFILVVEKHNVAKLQSLIGEESYVIGEIDEKEGEGNPVTELML